MYTFEKYMEMQQLCSMYKTKLDNWQNKRTSAIVERAEEGPSCFIEKENKILLSATADKRVLYHEMGHEMWHASMKKFGSIGHSELFHKFWNEGIGLIPDAVVWLEILKDEYQTNSISIIPISDALGMWMNEKIPGYYCHNQGYADKFYMSADIYSNEFFANICGLIGTYDIRGLMMVSDIFPKTWGKALDIIDEMMSKAITKEG